MKFAIIAKEDFQYGTQGEVVRVYESEESQAGKGIHPVGLNGGPLDPCVHVAIPEGIDERAVESYQLTAAKASAAVPAGKAAGDSSEGHGFEAAVAGEAGNTIALEFDGVEDVDTVLATWNDANPSNAVLTEVEGTEVLEEQTVVLTLGYEGFSITADDADAEGNADLIFDGVSTLKEIMDAHNATNETNTLAHDAQDDQIIPMAQTVDMSGGVDAGGWAIRESASKKAEMEAADALEVEDQKISVKRARREFGLQMVDLIQVKNDEGGITTAQTIAFMTMSEVQAIQGLLSAGAIESAKGQLEALPNSFFDQADIVLTTSDRDDVVAKIDAFLGA